MNGDDDSEVVSSDPFRLNELIQNHGKGDSNAEKDSSIPFPLRYTPDIVHSQSPVLEEHEKDTSRVMEDAQHVNVHASSGVESKTKTGGSVLEILDGIIKVGHAMGFNMEGCINDIKSIIDHRPILLREVVTDYGPIPFRFYHSWFSFEGFDQMVRETWNNIVLDDRSVMIQFKKKLQILKKEIRIWIGDYKKKHDGRINDLKSRLRDIDTIVDSGGANEDILLRANLAVKGIMVDGEWVDDPTRVKDEFKSHFASRFQAPNSNRCCFNFTFPKCLDTIQAEELESLISIEEVREAVWGCVDNKSPGPDGFTAEFFCKYWDILGSDLYDAVVWQILDGPFIINELLSWCKFKKQQAMVFKVDFEKAYDSVRWDFLQDILTAFGFGSKWCSWIRGCLQSATASVLLNGSPTSEFQFQCSLKQRDPLAPFLFILVMETLHLSFVRAVDAGIFKGLNIGTSVTMSHLFYADDAVFNGEWSNANISGITKILKCFSLLSGFKINLKKSHLLGVRLTNEVIEAAAENLGCATMKTLFKYLGVIVGGNCSKVHAWEDTISKVKARLYNWKLKLYQLEVGSPFLDRNFFNGVHCDERKITWVKWSRILASKKYGGLGVSSFHALNRALLFKWIWRFISGDNSLWCRFIKAMHGNNLFK
nr:RNA-directed DNA polymerase, eukaryota [Tanacetum cinerariifolium]